jgi:hypothetical protein
VDPGFAVGVRVDYLAREVDELQIFRREFPPGQRVLIGVPLSIGCGNTVVRVR